MIPPSVETLAIKLAELEKRLDERDRFRQAAIEKAATQQNEWGRSFQELKANFVTLDLYSSQHHALVERYEQGHRMVVARQDDILGRLSRIEGSEQKAQFNIANILLMLTALGALLLAIFDLIKR